MNTLTRQRRMRTNAGPTILTSTNPLRAKGWTGPGRVTNSILDHARDCFDGDMSSWASEVLWETQILRMAYDSPRIGGGIDPAIATGVPSLEWGRLDSSMLAYLIGSPESPYDGEGTTYDPDSMGALNGLTGDEIQDMIVHAEAVALLTLAVYGSVS